MTANEYDAVVVGAGPNGLVGAIALAGAGRKVLVLEAGATIGGGLRSAELTEPGFVHDICSTIQALGVASPAFHELPLADHGIEWCHPDIPLAHPLDDGRAALLRRDVDETANGFDGDRRPYRRLMAPFVDHADQLVTTFLSPLEIPGSPLVAARFGRSAIRSVDGLARGRFDGDRPQALLAGLAAHSIQPLTGVGTAGYGLFLGLLAHASGWPVVRGGSQQLANALGAILTDLGGEIVTDHRVRDLHAIPKAPTTMLDVTPRQLLEIGGGEITGRYRRALTRYRYGPGVFKIDWALDGPIPWVNPEVRRAGTVHLGGGLEEMKAAEAQVHAGRHPEYPYVIVVQATVMDPTRAPAGCHTAWAYCHVPNGSTVDQTEAIERQLERFAPGFPDVVRARATMNTAAMEAHNANYVGGDINGGAGDLRQLFTRPIASRTPWATSIPGVYLCSSATPPGGGVHGMGGLHAARLALARDC